MQFDSYTEFRSRVQILLEETNEPNDDNLLALDTMIALGEGIVHFGGTFAADGRRLGPLRASTMESALAGVVADNAFTLPDDCMELSIIWLDDGQPLDMVPERDLRDRLRWIGGGAPRRAAQAGESVIFSPTAEDGAVVSGRYYAKPADLKDGLHATFQRYPQLYLYAALSCGAPFYGQDSRVPVWQAFYSQLLDQANQQERVRVSSGGRLRQVSR